MPCLPGVEDCTKVGSVGFGTQIYIDTDACTGVNEVVANQLYTPDGSNSYVKFGCVTNFKPPYVGWDTIEDSECFDTDLVREDVTVPKLNRGTMSIRYEPCQDQDLCIGHLIGPNVDNPKPPARAFAMRLPFACTYVWKWFDAKMIKYEVQDIQSDQFMQANIDFVACSPCFCTPGAVNLGAGLDIGDGTFTGGVTDYIAWPSLASKNP